MADFVQSSQVKSAIRELAAPIQDAETFNSIVQSVINANPFGCVAYMTAGESHEPVEKTRESYTAKFVYEDADVKNVGSGSDSFNTLAGFNAGIVAISADTALAAAHAGTRVRDAEHDTFSATLRCHDPNGEIYNVNFSRRRVTITSYSDQSLRTAVETWADTVPALA